jgi:hypothetical protein
MSSHLILQQCTLLTEYTITVLTLGVWQQTTVFSLLQLYVSQVQDIMLQAGGSSYRLK